MKRMNFFNDVGHCCIALIAACSLSVCGKEPKMYLCADSSSQQSQPGEKMVYGYIEGKKTGCMTEYEFLALFNETQFKKDSVERSRQKLRALKRSQSKTSSAFIDSIIESIRGGEKQLDGKDLMGANFEGIDLSGVSLVSTDLRNANLRKANLSEAVLKAAYLRKTDCREADFSGANIKGAYFSHADLRGAKGLTPEMLKEAATFYSAKLDNKTANLIKSEMPEKLKKPQKCWANNIWSDNENCKPTKR